MSVRLRSAPRSRFSHRHPVDSRVVKLNRRIRSASVTMNVEGRRKTLRLRAIGDSLGGERLRMWLYLDIYMKSHRDEIYIFCTLPRRGHAGSAETFIFYIIPDLYFEYIIPTRQENPLSAK